MHLKRDRATLATYPPETAMDTRVNGPGHISRTHEGEESELVPLVISVAWSEQSSDSALTFDELRRHGKIVQQTG